MASNRWPSHRSVRIFTGLPRCRPRACTNRKPRATPWAWDGAQRNCPVGAIQPRSDVQELHAPNLRYPIPSETQSHCVGSASLDRDAGPRHPHARSLRVYLPDNLHLDPQHRHVRALPDGPGSPPAGFSMLGGAVSNSKRVLALSQGSPSTAFNRSDPRHARFRHKTLTSPDPEIPGSRIS